MRNDPAEQYAGSFWFVLSSGKRTVVSNEKSALERYG
jgi:hypothetical protein